MINIKSDLITEYTPLRKYSNQSVTIQGDLMISSGLENMTLKENSSVLRVWATLFVYR